MKITRQPSHRFRRAIVRGNCESCGKPIIRTDHGGRRPKFCSNACRQKAHRGTCYGTLRARVARVTNDASNPLKSFADKWRFAGSRVPFEALRAEVIDPHVWTEAVSPDGVRATIAQLPKQAEGLPEVGAPADFNPQLKAIDRALWDQLDIPDFLRRRS